MHNHPAVLPEPFANEASQHYVIPNGNGFRCVGFQRCFNEVYALAVLLNQDPPANVDFGTMRVFERHNELIHQVLVNNMDLGTWYDSATPLCVRSVLEKVISSGRRVRIFLGEPATGKADNIEYGVIGTIVTSSGTLKRPQFVTKSLIDAYTLSCSKIVRIIDAESMEDLYRHPTFHTSQFEVAHADDPESWHYVAKADGTPFADFDTKRDALNWVEFMRGNRLYK